jgi:hypothetical protein
MSLDTGKRLSRHWTEIPMTNAVISAVEAMAEKEGQQLINGGVPLFKRRPNASVDDFLEEDIESADGSENVAEDIFDPTEPDYDVAEEPDKYDGVEHLYDNDVVVPDGGDDADDIANFEPDPDDVGPDGLDPDADEGAEAHDDPGDDDPGDDFPDADNIAHDQRSVEPDANEDSVTNWYNLRSATRGRSNGHRLDHQMDDPVSSKTYKLEVQMLQQIANKMDKLVDNIYKYKFIANIWLIRVGMKCLVWKPQKLRISPCVLSSQ